MTDSLADKAREALELAQGILGVAGDEERIEVELAREVVRLSSLQSSDERSDWPTFNDGVEAAAVYCEKTLAGNHPHLAHAFRHAATNIRAFASVRICQDSESPVPSNTSSTLPEEK